MYDSVDPVYGEYIIHGALITQIQLIGSYIPTGHIANGGQYCWRAVRVVICHHYVVPPSQQLDTGVASDEASPSRHQYSHGFLSDQLTCAFTGGGVRVRLGYGSLARRDHGAVSAQAFQS